MQLWQYYVEIKCQLDATDVFIADLIACSTCFGHHYAHHQELQSIITVGCCMWSLVLGFQVVGMVWSWRLCVRFAGCCSSHLYNLYNTLELLMMGIVLPETCWACNKICNKYHLLHLVGILFPHINDDARSNSLQSRAISPPNICTYLAYYKVRSNYTSSKQAAIVSYTRIFKSSCGMWIN